MMRHNGAFYTEWTMTQMQFSKFKSHSVVNDTNAETQWAGVFYREWSMTRMHSNEFKSHPVVNDTNAFGQ